MAQKTTVQLKAEKDANINTNGVNAITGGNHNTFLENLLDSLINKSSDSLSIVTNVYRSASEAIITSPTQITFSSPLSSNVYEIVISDNNGIGFTDITDKQTTGFKITGLSNGTIIYMVFLTN